MICDRCKKESHEISFASFGKRICKECKDNRPNKGLGNSGMKDTLQIPLVYDDALSLVCVSKSNETFGNLFFSHYPESKGIVGRCLCYLICKDKEVIGIIGVSSPPKNYKIFKDYFNNVDEKYFVNNNIFRIVKSEKNLGTKILKLFRQTIINDYKQKYGNKIVGIVTFVEEPRTGAVYKADNWDYLGKTQGKRMRRDSLSWEKTFSNGKIKHIFGYKFI